MEAADRPVDVFISSVASGREWAVRMAGSLAAAGLDVVHSGQLLESVNAEPDRPTDIVRRARNLIVIWSAEARESRFVLAEIDLFWASGNVGATPVDRGRNLLFVDVGGGSAPASGMMIAAPDLETPAPAIPDEPWNAFIGRVLAMIGARTPPPTQKAKSSKRAASRPNRPAIPEGFRLFHSTRDILQHAGELGGAASTVLLLASICDRGTSSPPPTWSADWLRQRLGDDGMRRLKSLANEISDEDADGYEGALARAQTIAQRTSGTDEISVRHLLAALLTDERGGESRANQALAQLGQDVAAMRESLFDFVRGLDDEDDDDVWGHFLLGAKSQRPQLSGFDADAGAGDDQLDIRGDVMAFAGLIAARTLKPPLSIGLFGEWGSGKTFFMRMLMKQVAYLARQEREKFEQHQSRQRDQTFYRRIVQIEFNAWHYAEGNLWASLVQHIFDNLRVIDDRKQRVSEELQEPVLRKLQVENAAEAQAIRERQAAEQQRWEAVAALAAAKTQFEEKAKELAKISGKNILASEPAQALLATAKPLLESLGITAAVERGTELKSALGEARAVLERGQAVLTPLMTSKDRAQRWIWLILSLLIGPATALVAAIIAYANDSREIAGLTAMLSGVTAAIASVTTWIRKQVTWVGDQLTQVANAQREFEKSIEAAQAENLAAIRSAEEQLRLLEADYVAAKRREDEAHRRVQEAEAKVRESSIPRLLKTFIEERANSSDYRRHLGVLALVRNDFERLSDLISEENEHLNGPLADGPDKFPTAADEARDEQTRINRIVLYIDDLDRCPPAKVVEVLQAVHLLLAFPLFVVVVGVDARWLVRSLDARYRELLRTDGASATTEQVQEFNELFGNASAHDYIEKIFQVPFWIKPMTTDSSRRMVVELLKGSVAPADKIVSADATVGALAQPAASPASESRAIAERLSTESTQEPAPAANPTQTQSTVDPAPPLAPDLSPQGLSISRAELEFMSALAPLL
ncbi:MAG TPA: P-loop NTPase fold protein, partial [Steroidobacteraceae bacterium]|nr:P-loop NTPase fold protein [Steroidobacteraceae bacterium]